MWALAKFFRPDGISGYGMTNNPLARFAGASDGGKYSWLYEKSSCRIRERGKPDFLFYASGMTQNEIDRRYENCHHSPRFKSTEDTFMFFNIAALTETIMKLWRADFLPAAERTRGLAAIIRENLDLCFPDDSLNQVNVLELYGTEDEIMLGTKDPTLASTITAPYCKNFKMIFLEGLHHCTDAKHSSIFGAVWLDAIMDDYFNS